MRRIGEAAVEHIFRTILCMFKNWPMRAALLLLKHIWLHSEIYVSRECVFTRIEKMWFSPWARPNLVSLFIALRVPMGLPRVLPRTAFILHLQRCPHTKCLGYTTSRLREMMFEIYIHVVLALWGLAPGLQWMSQVPFENFASPTKRMIPAKPNHAF